MGLPGNLTLAVGGALIEGAVFVGVILTVRRVTKPPPRQPQQPLRMTATVRHELPAPPPKELTS